MANRKTRNRRRLGIETSKEKKELYERLVNQNGGKRPSKQAMSNALWALNKRNRNLHKKAPHYGPVSYGRLLKPHRDFIQNLGYLEPVKPEIKTGYPKIKNVGSKSKYYSAGYGNRK